MPLLGRLTPCATSGVEGFSSSLLRFSDDAGHRAGCPRDRFRDVQHGGPPWQFQDGHHGCCRWTGRTGCRLRSFSPMRAPCRSAGRGTPGQAGAGSIRGQSETAHRRRAVVTGRRCRPSGRGHRCRAAQGRRGSATAAGRTVAGSGGADPSGAVGLDQAQCARRCGQEGRLRWSAHAAGRAGGRGGAFRVFARLRPGCR